MVYLTKRGGHRKVLGVVEASNSNELMIAIAKLCESNTCSNYQKMRIVDKTTGSVAKSQHLLLSIKRI